MTVQFSDQGFRAPDIVFSDGVAALDLPTLHLAADTLARLGLGLTLPTVCDRGVPATFTDLAHIAIGPGPVVIVTIDTKKMVWDLALGDIRPDNFTDYEGVDRYGVRLGNRPFARVNQIAVSHAPLGLPDGSVVWMWFADVPQATIDQLDLYTLIGWAIDLSAGFATAPPTRSDITIPAQQIKYERWMPEIVALNAARLQSVKQQVFMAIDETGARVKVVTITRTSLELEPPPRPQHTFGAKHPVLLWLTEPDPTPDTLPFALTLTQSAAWLAPGTKVSFDDSAFTLNRDDPAPS